MPSTIRRFDLDKTTASEVRVKPGTTITCRTGKVWVTINGRPEDIVLYPGEAFRFERRETAFIAALMSSSAEWNVVAAPPGLLQMLGASVAVAMRGAFGEMGRALAALVHARRREPLPFV